MFKPMFDRPVTLMIWPWIFVNPLYSGNPYTSTFANSEDPGEMQHTCL